MAKHKVTEIKKDYSPTFDKPEAPKESVAPVAITPAVDLNELAHKKAIMDGLDADKKKRDAQTHEVESLEEQLKKLREQMDAQVSEFNAKKRINDNLGASINSANINLQMFDEKFKELNQERLAALEKKIGQVELADKELQALIKANREVAERLQVEMGQFEQEREANRQLVHAADTALAQNNAQWKSIQEDLSNREAAIKLEKAEFEAYKDSLTPEIARITSIKNDNQALCNKLERQTAEIERIRLESIREKQDAQESKAVSLSKNEESRQRVLNEEARLRKWEQDLKDQALELSAKQVEINKELRRQKLTEMAKEE